MTIFRHSFHPGDPQFRTPWSGAKFLVVWLSHMCLRNVDLFLQALLVDHRTRFYMSHRGSGRGTQKSLSGITSTGTEKILNKNLLNEEVNEQVACIFRNVL